MRGDEMRKTICTAFIALLMFGAALPIHAVMRPPRAPYRAPRTVPAQIHGLRYIAGVKAIDESKYPGDYRPKVWADFSKKDFSLRRRRIDQGTLNRKARKLEKVDIVRIPYKKVIDVWYGEAALKKLAVTKVPTLPRNVWNFQTGTYEPLGVYLDQRYRSPVVVIYKVSRKRKGAVLFTGPNEKAAACSALLLQHMKKGK
jgi:hypothetical protein